MEKVKILISGQGNNVKSVIRTIIDNEEQGINVNDIITEEQKMKNLIKSLDADIDYLHKTTKPINPDKKTWRDIPRKLNKKGRKKQWLKQR